jgi:hypothetical protein
MPMIWSSLNLLLRIVRLLQRRTLAQTGGTPGGKVRGVDELAALAQYLLKVAEQHEASAVSFDIRLREFVKQHFEKLDGADELDYLSWDLDLNSSTRSFVEKLDKVRLDERYKVCWLHLTLCFTYKYPNASIEDRTSRYIWVL